ncbi:hypothetical protein [Nocardia mexicana]|uniref:Uncharacterized protein n=1 Tax=Nocardia mexicana TaxID=279262 RepID=A0A370GMC0_9NOCA|nr:hypothetical protein [Nocardia mexicana]RDI43564.1 hypothetical protein DFR68_12031 [Nocardia mexicana]
MVVMIDPHDFVGMSRAERDRAVQRTLAAVPRRQVRDSGPQAEPLPRIEGLLPVPPPLAEILPEGGLRRGTVMSYAGVAGPLAGIVAAVTASGGNVALSGVPQLNPHAVVEMSGDLNRMYFVPDPGDDHAEVLGVLVDGFDLVVAGARGLALPPSRARAIAARARASGCSVILTGGIRWQGSGLRIVTRVVGYEGIERGCGRVTRLRFNIQAHGAGQMRSGVVEHGPADGSVEWARSAVAPVAQLRTGT